MNQIASIIEEKVKSDLDYKPWEVPQRLFKNLSEMCILNNVPMIMQGNRIKKVKLHVVDTKLEKDHGLLEAKPIIKDDRLYFFLRYNKKVKLYRGEVRWPDGKIWCSFPADNEVIFDAALAFGESVQNLD